MQYRQLPLPVPQLQYASKKLQFVNCIQDATDQQGAIYLGDIISTQEHTLNRLAIGAVLTCMQGKICMQNRHHLVLPVRDQLHEQIIEYFQKAIEFIEKQRKAKINVLVHCHAGLSRSATIVCAYFVNKYAWHPEKALEYVRRRRERARPNVAFWEQLLRFYDMLKNEQKVKISEDRKIKNNSEIEKNISTTQIDKSVLISEIQKKGLDSEISSGTILSFRNKSPRSKIRNFSPRTSLVQKSPTTTELNDKKTSLNPCKLSSSKIHNLSPCNSRKVSPLNSKKVSPYHPRNLSPHLNQTNPSPKTNRITITPHTPGVILTPKKSQQPLQPPTSYLLTPCKQRAKIYSDIRQSITPILPYNNSLQPQAQTYNGYLSTVNSNNSSFWSTQRQTYIPTRPGFRKLEEQQMAKTMRSNYVFPTYKPTYDTALPMTIIESDQRNPRVRLNYFPSVRYSQSVQKLFPPTQFMVTHPIHPLQPRKTNMQLKK